MSAKRGVWSLLVLFQLHYVYICLLTCLLHCFMSRVYQCIMTCLFASSPDLLVFLACCNHTRLPNSSQPALPSLRVVKAEPKDSGPHSFKIANSSNLSIKMERETYRMCYWYSVNAACCIDPAFPNIARLCNFRQPVTTVYLICFPALRLLSSLSLFSS